MSGHPLYWLVFVTLLCVVAFLFWERRGVRRLARSLGETPGEVGITPPEKRPGKRL